MCDLDDLNPLTAEETRERDLQDLQNYLGTAINLINHGMLSGATANIELAQKLVATLK